MARLSGFLTAFNISVSPSFKNNQFRFFSERFYTSADSFISKNEGMAELAHVLRPRSEATRDAGELTSTALRNPREKVSSKRNTYYNSGLKAIL
jgi:hypothetical protein